ncbi:hypothetical protein C4E44_34020 [Pseudomonas sp. MWU12-2312b]|nr:hypothetical protein C4E44_34020 [Pseudomonas sp. MWU12-2312b]
MVATSNVMAVFTLLLVAYLRFFGRPKYPEVFLYFILGLLALFLIVAIIIVVVEWFENNGNSIDAASVEKVLNVCFHSKGVSVEMSVGAERFVREVSIAGIKSVSGYIQDGWLWVRDRGVVIELSSGEQFRLVLSFSKFELDCFLKDFVSSLNDMDFPVKKLRKFQV